jgi:hypothetical protein
MKEFLYKSILVFYCFLSLCLYGLEMTGFFYIYSAARPEIILSRLGMLSDLHLYSCGAGMAFTLVFSLFFIVNKLPVKSITGIDLASLRTHLRWQWFYLSLLLAGCILWRNDLHFNIVYLFIFMVAVFSLFLCASCFYRGEKKSWRHPTSYGNFYVSALIQGWAIFNILGVAGTGAEVWLITVMVLLVFELLIIYNRFVYLSRSGSRTRVVTQQLVGPYRLYFLARLVLGIFIPLLLIARSLALGGTAVSVTGILLVTAGVIDKMLFIFLTDSPA